MYPRTRAGGDDDEETPQLCWGVDEEEAPLARHPVTLVPG